MDELVPTARLPARTRGHRWLRFLDGTINTHIEETAPRSDVYQYENGRNYRKNVSNIQRGLVCRVLIKNEKIKMYKTRLGTAKSIFVVVPTTVNP